MFLCTMPVLYIHYIKIVASTSVVTSVSIPPRKFVDGMLRLFVFKNVKKKKKVISTGTICMSCVIGISHVFQNYFGRSAGTCVRDVTSFSSVIQQEK